MPIDSFGMDFIKLSDGGIDEPLCIKVEIVSATQINFTLRYGDINRLHEATKDICAVAPHMIELDSDLMEAYDGGFDTMPQQADIIAVRQFIRKWKDQLDEDLDELFFS